MKINPMTPKTFLELTKLLDWWIYFAEGILCVVYIKSLESMMNKTKAIKKTLGECENRKINIEQELQSALIELELYKKDALRYRWLRKQSNVEKGLDVTLWDGHGSGENISDQTLDIAIDVKLFDENIEKD